MILETKGVNNVSDEKGQRTETESMRDLFERTFPEGANPLNIDPWDWRMFAPLSLDDEAVLEIEVQQESTDQWISHRFSIALKPIVHAEEQNND